MKTLNSFIMIPVSKPLRVLGVNPKAGGFLMLLGVTIAVLLEENFAGILFSLIGYGLLLCLTQKNPYIAETILVQCQYRKGIPASVWQAKEIRYDA